MPKFVIAAIRGLVLLRRRPSGLVLARFEHWQTATGSGAAIASCGDEGVWAITDREGGSLAPGRVLTRSEPEIVPLPPERLVGLGLAPIRDEPCLGTAASETGFQVIDVLAPLVEGSWVLGGANVDRAQLLDELRLRCARRRSAQTLVFPLLPSSAAVLERPGELDKASSGVRSLWLNSDHIEKRTLAEIDALGHTRLFCGPRPPARGCWPATDPLASRSRALSEPLVEPAHIEPAFAVLEPLFVDRRRADLRGAHVASVDALVGCRGILVVCSPIGGFDYSARPES